MSNSFSCSVRVDKVNLVLPPQETDIVKIKLTHAENTSFNTLNPIMFEFEIPYNHTLPIRWNDSPDWHEVRAGDLKPNMLLYTRGGFLPKLRIIDVQRDNHRKEQLVELLFEPRDKMVFLFLGPGASIGVHSSEPYEFHLDRRTGFYGVKAGRDRSIPAPPRPISDPGEAPSLGSQGHPQCNGRCKWFHNPYTHCMHGRACLNCHYPGCKQNHRNAKQRSRQRRSRGPL